VQHGRASRRPDAQAAPAADRRATCCRRKEKSMPAANPRGVATVPLVLAVLWLGACGGGGDGGPAPDTVAVVPAPATAQGPAVPAATGAAPTTTTTTASTASDTPMNNFGY
jgi:hypothetical protein